MAQKRHDLAPTK